MTRAIWLLALASAFALPARSFGAGGESPDTDHWIRVSVFTAYGPESFTGRAIHAGVESLIVSAGESHRRVQSWRWSEVDRVEWRESSRGHALLGAVLGGLAAFGLASALIEPQEGTGSMDVSLGPIPFLTLAGAAVGAGLGGQVRTETWSPISADTLRLRLEPEPERPAPLLAEAMPPVIRDTVAVGLGTTVRVSYPSTFGTRRFSGVLSNFDSDSLLVCRSAVGCESLRWEELTGLEHSIGRRSCGKQGALIGAGIILALGMAAAITADGGEPASVYGPSSAAAAGFVAGVVGAPLGALLGFLIGSGIRTDDWEPVPADSVRPTPTASERAPSSPGDEADERSVN